MALKQNARAISSRWIGHRGTSLVATAFRRWREFSFGPGDIGASQSDESALIANLVEGLAIPHTFCEFGFHVAEFNCGKLVRGGWEGLLIDGDEQRVRMARNVVARDPALRVEVKQLFLTTANLAPTIRGYLGERALGVLSVDVDGNDYWFLRELLPLRPYVIIVEYNGSFGLRPITVPYDPAFERHAKHPSGWYHGASISAFHGLCTQHGYSLIGTSQDGLNLFFIRADVAPDGTKQLVPSEAYRENQLRNRWSGTSADQQWQVLHDLPFVEV